MRFGSTFRIALRALKRNKMRSTLTALGIIIGVGAVIAMVSIGNGAQAQVQAQIAGLGKNVIFIWAGSSVTGGVRFGSGSSTTLKVEDAEAIAREIPQITIVNPEVVASYQAIWGNRNWYTHIFGESPEFFEMRQWPLESGTIFTDQDVRSAAKVAVIGRTIVQKLFGNTDPLGQTVRIKNVPFLVIGVLTPKGLSGGNDNDDNIYIPYTSGMKRVMGINSLRSIGVQVEESSDIEFVQQQLFALMRQRHGTTNEKDDDFTIRTQEEIVAAATETSQTMTYLVGSIAAVSLLVGGIGIMNIMLVSVTERTREIGIRIAVGAHARDILLQFLIEAITLSSLGGIVGILAGVGGSKIISMVKDWPSAVSVPSIIGAFIFSSAVGIFFGFYPAWKASKLDPIEALRYE